MEIDKTATLANLRSLQMAIAEEINRAVDQTDCSGLIDGIPLGDKVTQCSKDMSYVRNLMIELEGGNSAIEEYPWLSGKTS